MNCQTSLPSQRSWAERVPAASDVPMESIEPVVQSSWTERISDRANIVFPEPIVNFLQMPFPSAMLGAAIHTGDSSLLANTYRLLDDEFNGDETKLCTSSAGLLSHYGERLEAYWGCEDFWIRGDLWEKELYELLFHLLIEPFALMNQHDTAPDRSNNTCLRK